MDNPHTVSLSHMSIKGFKYYLKYRNYNREHILKLPVIKDYKLDNLIREALIGGRCQAFSCGDFNNIDILDVVSLYPNIMSTHIYPMFVYDNNNNLIKGSLIYVNGYGIWEYVNGYGGTYRHGIYYVTIRSQPLDKIVPYNTSQE